MKRWLWFVLVPVIALAGGFAGGAGTVQSVGRHESSAWGFRTNSFWIEGPDGVVLVDTQFLPSAAVDAFEAAAHATGKPVVLALVLHPNPDKFNGTGALAARGVPVLTSQQVRDAIPAVDRVRREWFEARYRPDYPPRLVLPDAFGDRTRTLHVAGLVLTLHVLGAAVGTAHVVVEVDGHLFVGDLVANRHHAWLELGLVEEWDAMLGMLAAKRPRHVHPGRGESGGAELLDAQRKYLRDVARIVADAPEGPGVHAFDAAAERVRAAYPGYGNAFFVERAVRALWRRRPDRDPPR